MANALSGFRVLEVASWMFVPSAGAVLADWGADVIKVEHPVTGDPQRGLSSMGLIPGGDGAVNYIIEQPNRGKRSIGIDISTDGGRELLYQLAETSDVFLTSFLPAVRQRLKIDVEHIKAVNPRIVYARGTGQGPLGPDREKGGYDGASYWGRGAVGSALKPADAEFPIGGRPGFGDLAGGMAIAGGIAAGLLQRATTGEAPVVDVSLLGIAMWMLSPDIVASGLYGGRPDAQVRPECLPQSAGGELPDRRRPLHHADDAAVRPLLARLLHPHRTARPHRGPPVRRRGRPVHQRQGAGRHHRRGLRLEDVRGVEAGPGHPGGRLGPGAAAERAGRRSPGGGQRLPGPCPTGRRQGVRPGANPVQMDESGDQLVPAPEHGQHTEEILLELGLGWDEIVAAKDAGSIL